MKTLQVSASLSRAAGGIFEIELALAKQLSAQGVEVIALGLKDELWESDAVRWDGVNASVYEVKRAKSFGYAPELLENMMRHKADLAHLHYMWMYPSIAVSGWARRRRKPYMVTPNGMLEPWALSNSAWKKKIAGFLYENRMLHGASCLHANTGKELSDIRAFGLKNPVCVIPNGVDLVDAKTLHAEALKEGPKTLLFLGRLHPKKGLVGALRAWKAESGKRKPDGWQFVIAGWDQGGHRAELERLCRDIGLVYADIPAAEFVGDSTTEQKHPIPLVTGGRARRSSPTVVFTGPAFGVQKDALLRRADAFILPSFSEGLPMSVLEAWSYRLPVLITDHCNLPEGFMADAAIRIGTDVESIAEGMRVILQSTIPDLQLIGQNGRSLVECQFTWPQVAAQMKEVYEWVLGGGPKPECVDD